MGFTKISDSLSYLFTPVPYIFLFWYFCGGIDLPNILVISETECLGTAIAIQFIFILIRMFLIGYDNDINEVSIDLGNLCLVTGITLIIYAWTHETESSRSIFILAIEVIIGLFSSVVGCICHEMAISDILEESQMKKRIPELIKEEIDRIESGIFKDFRIEIVKYDGERRYIAVLTISFDVFNGVGTILARKTEETDDWEKLGTEEYKDWRTGIVIPRAINDYFEKETSLQGSYQHELSLTEIINIVNALEKGTNIKEISEEYFGYNPGKGEEKIQKKEKKEITELKSRTQILKERMEEMEASDPFS